MDLKTLAKNLHPSALLFDIDGVLLNVRDSYLKAIELAVARGLKRQKRSSPPALTALVTRLKRVKGYNNDWDCAYALTLLGLAAPTSEDFTGLFTALENHHQGLEALEATLLPLLPDPAEYDKALIWRDFQGYYLGRDKLKELYGAEADFDYPPLYLTEDAHVPRLILEHLSQVFKIGVYTGRSPEEAALAFERLGLAPHAVVADDGACRKPDPAGLQRLQRQLDFKRALYFGDSVDDATAILRFGATADIQLVAIGAELEGAVLRLEAKDLGAALKTIL
jgi:phosphoglycolate phosphatase-like HAD superfamily hydrolase